MSWHTTGTQKQIAPDRYVLQLQGELAESRLRGRASFLRLIAQLRPNVVTDLWDKAFPEFKQAVHDRFRLEISHGIDLEKYLSNKEEEFLRNPKTCGDYRVALLQQRLSPRLIGANEPDLVGHEFFSYSLVKERGYQTLVERIHKWSKTWNLDAEWCRDHALAVLRAWLFEKELRWIGVFPHRLLPVQLHGWRMAAAQWEEDGLFSRVVVEVDIESSPLPKPLNFNPKKGHSDLKFETFWNTAIESESQFKKRARVDFRIWLTRAEEARLMLLKEQDESQRLGAKDFEKRLAGRNLTDSGVKEQFDQVLGKYARRMRVWKKKAKAKYKFQDDLENRHQGEHLVWLVLYQVPDSDDICLTHAAIVGTAYHLILSLQSSCSLLNYDLIRRTLAALEVTYAYIAEGATLNADSVRKGIQKAAKLIDLRLRNPRRNAGRKPSSREQLQEN